MRTQRLNKFLQRWTIPLLLSVVAIRQIFLAHTASLSAWHGGGFGMFASIDRDERRIVEIQAIDCQANPLTIELDQPANLLSPAALKHLRTLPTPVLLEETAHRILEARLQPSEQSDVYYALHPSELAPTTCLQQVKIQVWRVYHQRQSNLAWYEPITPVIEVSQ